MIDTVQKDETKAMRNGIDYTRARARRRAAVVVDAAAAAAVVFRPYALCPCCLTLCSCCLAYRWRHVQPLSLDVESYMINTMA